MTYITGWKGPVFHRRQKCWLEFHWADSGRDIGNLTPGLIPPLESEDYWYSVLFHSIRWPVNKTKRTWFGSILNESNRRVFSAPWFHEIFLQIFWLLLLRIVKSKFCVCLLFLIGLSKTSSAQLHQWKFRPFVITHKSQFCVCLLFLIGSSKPSWERFNERSWKIR